MSASFSPLLAGLAGMTVLVATVVVFSAGVDRLAYTAVGIFIVSITWNGIRFAGGAFADALMVIAFIAVIALVAWERRPVLLPGWMLAAGAGLLVAALLTLVFPPNLKLIRATLLFDTTQTLTPTILTPRSNFAALAKFELAWLVTPLLLAVTATTPRRCARLLDLWTLSAIVSAIVAIFDFTGIVHLAPRAITNHRSSGLTIHPNYLAFNSTLALPFALLWLGRGRRWAIAGLIGAGSLLAGVYSSGSRAATVGAVIALGLTFVVVPRLRRIAGIAVPFAGMLIIALLLFTDAGSQILHQLRLNPGNSTAQASNFERGLGAQVAFTQIQARPLEGVGFSVIEDAHNIYLQLLAAGGVIALISFIVYFGGLAICARRAWSGPQRAEVSAAIVSIVVWLVAGTFDNQLIDKFLYVVPGLLFAMSCVAASYARDLAHQRPSVLSAVLPPPAPPGRNSRSSPILPPAQP